MERQPHDPVQLANILVGYAVIATPVERLTKIEEMLSVLYDTGDEGKEREKLKAQQRRMNNYLMVLLKARDQMALELQIEPWDRRPLEQLALWDQALKDMQDDE